MSGLVDSITLENADGVEIDLQVDGARMTAQWDGLQGLSVKENVSDRPSAHGSINRSRYRGDRLITASNATFHGDTPDDAWEQYHEVSRALAGAVDTDRLLRVELGGLQLQTYVRLSSMQPPVVQVQRRCIACQYTLRASDPRLYSQIETEFEGVLDPGGGGLTAPFTAPITVEPLGVMGAPVVNDGTVPVPAVITLGGYLLDPRLRIDAGHELILDGEIAADSSVVIDLAARTITLDGADAAHLRNFAEGGWFELPVGESTLQLRAANAVNPSMTVSLREAYE